MTAATGQDERGPVVLALARAAIAQAMGGPRVEKPAHAWLDEPGACFITLKQDGELRGCIGNITPTGTLYESIVRNAVSAALRDPRFPALRRDELAGVTVEASLLSAPEPLAASTREQLLAGLRPGVDGLVLTAGARGAVFIPSVWEQLPDPRDFVAHLLRKGGMSAERWPADMRAERFTATHYEETR